MGDSSPLYTTVGKRSNNVEQVKSNNRRRSAPTEAANVDAARAQFNDRGGRLRYETTSCGGRAGKSRPCRSVLSKTWKKLHWRLSLVQRLLDEGARIEAKDDQSMTLLHLSAATGCVESIQAKHSISLTVKGRKMLSCVKSCEYKVDFSNENSVFLKMMWFCSQRSSYTSLLRKGCVTPHVMT